MSVYMCQGKLVVGHNMILDVLHIIEHFVTPLPHVSLSNVCHTLFHVRWTSVPTSRRNHSIIHSVLDIIVPDLTFSNPAGVGPGRIMNSNPDGARAGFRENVFSDHRTMHLMKLLASTMLLAATECSTVQCFSCYVSACQFLTKYMEL